MAEMKKKKADLIFIPSPGVGPLASSIEFAQLLGFPALMLSLQKRRVEDVISDSDPELFIPELEHYAIDALSDGQIPPIYAVSPLVNLRGHPNPNLNQTKHDSNIDMANLRRTTAECFQESGCCDDHRKSAIKILLLFHEMLSSI
ncbi:hypothetical protein RIF29_17108 [Crotalaria pallida]|uniref:Uncharacterized protein n=1 Tax=Crotalaria pallida TaxID=3830 RepID=A0AAN9IG56_CROPI